MVDPILHVEFTEMYIINKMYSTSNGYLIHRDRTRFIGAPGVNSRASPHANVDYGALCAGTAATDGSIFMEQRYCFQPAFVTPKSCIDGPASALTNCVGGAASQSSCIVAGDTCHSQRQQMAFESDNAKVVSKLSAAEFAAYSAAVTPDGPSIEGRPYCKNGMLLLSTRNEGPVVACPLPNDVEVEPQYQQAILDMWQPGRFAETNKPDAHRMAAEIRDKCFFKDVVYPNGTILPLAVRMTPKCIAAADAAIRTAAPVTSRACGEF